MCVVMEYVYEFVKVGQKLVIWIIFIDIIESFMFLFVDLNLVCIYGRVLLGLVDDLNIREGWICCFYRDNSCYVLIVNFVVVGEGISLYIVCYNVIYVD